MGQNNASPFKRRYLVGIVLAIAAVAAAAYFFNIGRQAVTPPGPPEKVTIAYSATVDVILAAVAKVRDFYREEGLEATARLHPYGRPALQDVLEGKADFATVAETPVMFAIMKGERISVIATIQTTNQGNAVVARRDRGIRTFGGLRGRKIAATLGTTSDYFLDAVLGVEGIARKDVTVVDLKADEMPKALARGDVDAASVFIPYIIPAQKKLGEAGITFYNRDIYTMTFNVVARQEFIHQNPGKVVKMLRALLKAEEFVKHHTAEAQRIVADFSRMDIDAVRAAWAGADIEVKLDQSLLLALEDESQWAIKNRLTGGRTNIPNYLDFIYFDGLTSVKPKAVNILR